jgi:hypothetical protein
MNKDIKVQVSDTTMLNRITNACPNKKAVENSTALIINS